MASLLDNLFGKPTVSNVGSKITKADYDRRVLTRARYYAGARSINAADMVRARGDVDSDLRRQKVTVGAAAKPKTPVIKETPQQKQLRTQLAAANKAYAEAEAKGNRAAMKKYGAQGRKLWIALYGGEGIDGIGCGDRPCDQCKGDEEAAREAGGGGHV